MRLAVVFAVGLACAALAVQPPADPAHSPDPGASGAARIAETPKGVPVPQGEVVKRTELEGGLIIEDIRLGDGYEVKAGGGVYAHYHGTLKASGKVFDSSFERGEPIAFPLSGVIEGWQKGVPGMRVGGVRRITIPAAMAYGAAGSPPAIPPNSDLVFVIALVQAIEVEEIRIGEGEAAGGQCVAATAYDIKDKDGKVLASADAASPFIWFPREYLPVSVALDGMKVGGKRKVTVPKELNPPARGGPAMHPADMAVTIEIEVLALRNIPQPGR